MHYTRDTSICITALLAWLGCGSDDPARDAALAPLRDMAGAAAPGPRKGYVGLFGDGAVGVLDLDARRMIKTVPVTAPDGLVITPDNAQVFVSSTDSGQVIVISTQDDRVLASIDVGDKPAGLTLTPDGRQLVASVGGANQAVVIDTATHAVLARADVGQAHSSCITADGHYAYVGAQVPDAPAVVRVDLSGQSEPHSFAVDKAPRALACESDAIYFTAVGLDGVEKLDFETGALATPISTGGSPHDLRAAHPGQLELVVSQTAGDLELIDVPAAGVTATIPTGKLAHWIALDASGQTAYVSNEGDDDVSIVDLASRQVTATIAVGDAPRKLAIQR